MASSGSCRPGGDGDRRERLALREPDKVPINERYYITRVHPDDFLWDDNAGPLEAISGGGMLEK